MSITQDKSPRLRRVAFGGLAAFILWAPAIQQVFHIYSPLFRPWVMYSGVGLGLLRGDVEITRTDGSERLSPEAFLNVRFYPSTMSIRDRHVVLDEGALVARIKAYCRANPDAIAVSFEGEVSGLQGWRPISAAEACTR